MLPLRETSAEVIAGAADSVSRPYYAFMLAKIAATQKVSALRREYGRYC